MSQHLVSPAISRCQPPVSSIARPWRNKLSLRLGSETRGMEYSRRGARAKNNPRPGTRGCHVTTSTARVESLELRSLWTGDEGWPGRGHSGAPRVGPTSADVSTGAGTRGFSPPSLCSPLSSSLSLIRVSCQGPSSGPRFAASLDLRSSVEKSSGNAQH